MENEDKKQTAITITPKQLFERPDVQERFKSILGKKAQGFIVSVINCISSNALLQKADQNSILFAAANAATLDLPINPNLGFAYIVPYNTKQPDGTYKQMAQFQMGYKGFIQLAMRTGQFKTISASKIYEGQLVEENPLTGYKFDFTKKTSDKIIGYAGYFQLVNGFEKVFYMTVEDIDKHGAKYSKTFKQQYGLWQTDREAMSEKTVIKLMLSKFAPMSIEMQRATLTDQSVIKDWEGEDFEYVDNEPEKIDLEAQNKRKEEERIKGFIESAAKLEVLELCKDTIFEQYEEGSEIRVLYEKKLKKLTPKKSKKADAQTALFKTL